MVAPTHSQCKGQNAAGAPCSAQPVRADGYCYWHSPATAEERAEARRRGGFNKSNKARAAKAAEGMSLAEIDRLLAVALKGTLTGRLTPGQGTAAAAIARAMVTVREAHTLEDLTQRLDELERRARGRLA